MSEEIKEEVNEVEVIKPSEIQAVNGGMLVGSTLNEQWRLAKAYCSSGMLPKAYKTPEQVLTGMQYAYELGLKPLSALKNIAVINGMPSLWGELPLAIVRNSGKLTMIKEYLIDSKYEPISLMNKNLHETPYAAVCLLQREGSEEIKEFIYTREMRKKQNGGVAAIWSQYEEVMFKRKARSTGLKDLFGDILEGMNIAEYDFNISPRAGRSYEVDHNGRKSSSSILNSISNDDSESLVGN